MSAPDPRIAIVGSGPSGLTLACYLKNMGLKSVHLFEAQKEVGGQSVTHDIDGFQVEMGTVYLTDGYILAKRIAKKVGCPAEVLPKASVLDADGNFRKNLQQPSTGLMLRYVLAWLRWHFAGQMREPTQDENALPFTEWLEKHNFGDLASSFVFTAGMTAQLYGPLGDVSAHSGLSWMRPSLLITGKYEQTAHIPAGFQPMWEKLAQYLDFPIQYGQQIDTVQPTADDRHVELLYGGEPIDEPFDHVFLACPLDYLENHPLEDVDGNPMRPIQHPLTSLLKQHPFKATEVYSAAWRATNWPEKDAPSRCYLPAAGATDEEKVLGPLLTIRQYGDIGGRYVGQLCSYAFPDDRKEDTEQRFERNQERLERNRKQVIADMENIVKLKEIEILHDRLWRYNIRYSSAQIKDGLPLKINKAQGEQHVWYTGGTLSHWNIDAITDYNHWLAHRFAKRIGIPWLTRFKCFRFGNLLSEF